MSGAYPDPSAAAPSTFRPSPAPLDETSPATAVPRLHVVTDDEVLRRPDFPERARRVLAAGPGVALHLRGPGTGARRVWELARELRGGPAPEPGAGAARWEPRGHGGGRGRRGGRGRHARRRAGEAAREAPDGRPVALLLVNDRVDVARVVDADGVHLGGRSLPASMARTLLPGGALVGVSVHGAEAAAEAAAEGADYLMVGTIFATPSHPGRPGAGPEVLRAVVRRGAPPLVAVGGITPDRVATCLEAGAHGVAVLRGVWEASDTSGAVAGYVEALGAASAVP